MKSSVYLKLGSIILALFLLLGCNDDENNFAESVREENTVMENYSADIEELNRTIEDLQEKLDLLDYKFTKLSVQMKELEYEFMVTNKTMTSFPSAWPVVQNFVDAYFALDLDAMQELISDKYTVHAESISYVHDSEGRIHMPHLALKGKIDSHFLNSFGYHPMQSNTLFFFQIMFVRDNQSGFMNLHMKRNDDKWMVEAIEFDI